MKEVCPVCGKLVKLTQHHVLPKRFFNPRHKGNKVYIYLCRDCHDKIELNIALEEMEHGGQLTRARYIEIAKEFLEGEQCYA